MEISHPLSLATAAGSLTATAVVTCAPDGLAWLWIAKAAAMALGSVTLVLVDPSKAMSLFGSTTQTPVAQVVKLNP